MSKSTLLLNAIRLNGKRYRAAFERASRVMTTDELFILYRTELNHLIANGAPFAAVQAQAFESTIAPLLAEYRKLKYRCARAEQLLGECIRHAYYDPDKISPSWLEAAIDATK
jgi:hypothetical protein